jgi:lipopolysaccharide assembly outer membrane protein LptD (OstA)
MQNCKYLIKIKNLLIHFLLCSFYLSILGGTLSMAQKPKGKPNKVQNVEPAKEIEPKDSIPKIAKDTLVQDSIKKDTLKKRKDGLQTTVKYYARDSITSDVEDQIAYLYGNAVIIYGDTKLEADYIEMNWRTNIVKAYGNIDSTGKVKGRPLFTQKGDKFVSDTITYNTQTKKGIIREVVTQQGDAFVRGSKVKKTPDNVMYLNKGMYTTCNMAEPHFHIQARKVKLIPEKSIVTGPFTFFIGKSPMPLVFPFGMFPTSNQRRSGIVIPIYGESADRGFFLRQGGYYWAIGEKAALTFVGEVYTNGSWGLSTNAVYKQRYHYEGTASVTFNERINGQDKTWRLQKDFWVTWNHRTIPRGTTSFSATVNLGTTTFNRNNSFVIPNFLASTFNSSISITKFFRDTPFNAAINLRQDQNTQTGAFNVAAPELNVSMNRIFPFKSKGAAARNWIQNINLSYTFTGAFRLSNTYRVSPGDFSDFTVLGSFPTVRRDTFPDFYDTFSKVVDRAIYGGVSTIPITTTVKVFRFISLNPSLNYQEFWYPKHLDYRYVADSNKVKVDTINGFSRAYAFSMAANLTTRLYGVYLNKGGGRLEGIRHTIVPTIGISYTPDFSNPEYGFYQQIQVDSTGRTKRVSRYLGPGFAFGSPGRGESGNINYSLSNIFEMKLRPKTDTGKAKKVNLLENITASGSYNFLADTLRWSNINLSARTRLLDFIDLQASATLNPYIVIPKITTTTNTTTGEVTKVEDKKSSGLLVDRLAILNGQGLGRFTNFQFTVGANFTPKAFKDIAKRKRDEIAKIQEQNPRLPSTILNNPEAYVDFDIPWTLNVNYFFTWSQNGFSNPVQSQTINFRGELSITKTWKIGVSSGYDVNTKKISFTTVDINKNLHCWSISLNWIPFGARQSFSFAIFANAGMLRDLRLTRQRSWYDR